MSPAPTTDAPPIRVLQLEDNPRDAEIMQDMLDASGIACSWTHVTGRKAFELALAGELPELVITDFNLPDMDGLTAVALTQTRDPELPVIVVSGAMDPSEAVQCLHAGATDYVLKDRMERLPSAVERAIAGARERRHRHEIEAALRETEERFRRLAENSAEGFWFVEAPDRLIYASPAVEAITGFPPDRLQQEPRAWLGDVHPEDRGRVEERWRQWAAGRSARFEEECRITRPDGATRWVLHSGTRVMDGEGTFRLSGVTRDLTDRKDLEAQFYQAQKVEGLGRIAAGIAHDFNNLLAVILGFSDLILDRDDVEEGLAADVDEIRKAGERASQLTGQLLAFGRKQSLVPRVLELNRLMADMKRMAGRVVGERVKLELVPGESLWRTKADASQVEQVVMNLIVNARDAMPRGGTVRITTANAVLDPETAARFPNAEPGRYASIAVSDTGVGMDKELLARIFEPFFTTKPIGRGTGLGLATVYGIVRQHRGFVTVDSTVGVGTTFTTYWPRVEEIAAAPKVEPAARRVDGNETVLIVDDDAGVRALVRKMLEGRGYRVLVAKDDMDAVAIAESVTEPIRLLLTDIVMPGLNGPDLAQRLVVGRPTMAVLYMSGYVHNVDAGLGSVSPHVDFVQKPFTSDALVAKVRECLDVRALPAPRERIH